MTQAALDMTQAALDRSPLATVPDGDQHSTEVQRRQELGAFLRSRREAITPAQVGLPQGGRRRTPGLRREEVAYLAAVGVTWYTWLEQGRDITVSGQVLEAISRVLMLDPDERSHLFTLAGGGEQEMQKECQSLLPSIQVILDQLDPFPACVLNARFHILAFNRAYGELIVDLAALSFEARNTLLLCFTNPQWRAAIVDWEESAGRMVANLRAAMAEHVAEPAWKTLVGRLIAVSSEFAVMWERHEVRGPENRTKHLINPKVGLLHLDYTNLWAGPRLGTRLVTYTPADPETQTCLEKLAADRAGQATGR
ncbi:MAG TPA: helix-turn-helix transcriptional regulator [Streptosporangiaceae bacterium]|jgi:transcriptional regulator with XRE-family HTH domain